MKRNAFALGLFGATIVALLGAVGGYPFNPRFGEVTANSVSVDGAQLQTLGLNLGEKTLWNVADPTAGNNVGDRDYNDARYLQLTGGMVTGTDDLAGNVAPNASHFPTTFTAGTAQVGIGQNNGKASIAAFGSGTNFELHLNPTVGDVFIGGNLAWHEGNDGAGSGLDADRLDGITGSAYAALVDNETVPGTWNFTAAPTISGNEIWHAGNDGDASGLDADQLKGVDVYIVSVDMDSSCSLGLLETVPGIVSFASSGVGQCEITHNLGRSSIAIVSAANNFGVAATPVFCEAEQHSDNQTNIECWDAAGTPTDADGYVAVLILTQ